jgi:hypothetical protein
MKLRQARKIAFSDRHYRWNTLRKMVKRHFQAVVARRHKESAK